MWKDITNYRNNGAKMTNFNLYDFVQEPAFRKELGWGIITKISKQYVEVYYSSVFVKYSYTKTLIKYLERNF